MKRILGNRILRAYGSSVLGVFSGLLTSFWLLREVTAAVAPHDFGIYAFVFQITSYVAVLQLGLDFAASREIAARLGQKDLLGAKAVFAVLHRFNWRVGMGVLLAVIGASVAIRVVGLPGRQQDEANLIAWTILLVGASQILSVVSRPYVAVLIGGMHQTVPNFVQLGSGVVTAFVAFGLLRAGLGLLCLPLASVLVGVGTLAVLRDKAYRLCPWLGGQAEKPKRDVFREMVRFGGLSTLHGVAWTIESTSDVVLLATFGSAQLVAVYTLWWRFPQMLFDLCTRLASSAFPEFSNRNSQNPAAAALLLRKVGIVSVLVTPLACVGIGIWLPNFIELWVGPQFALPYGKRVAVLMGVLVLLRTWGNLLGMFALSQGRAGYTAILSWTQAGLKLLLGIFLVRSNGLEGLLIASVVCAALQVTVFSWSLHNSGVLVSADLVTAVVLAGVSVAFAIVLRPTLAFDNVWSFTMGTCATAIAWAAIWAAVTATTRYLSTVKQQASRH
jgi:O-antigen/teichoic acid export membrane protein